MVSSHPLLDLFLDYLEKSKSRLLIFQKNIFIIYLRYCLCLYVIHIMFIQLKEWNTVYISIIYYAGLTGCLNIALKGYFKFKFKVIYIHHISARNSIMGCRCNLE